MCIYIYYTYVVNVYTYIYIYEHVILHKFHHSYFMDSLASPSDSSVTHCEPEARLGVLTAREIITDPVNG